MSPSALLSSFSPRYHKLTPVPEDSHVDFSDEEEPEVVQHPFKGLIICATGVPKDVRKQMREVTERLGGAYSPDLHRACTHLVVQGTSGQKFQHAVKHGEKWGLKVVTMRWFLVSLQLNARMDENPYKVIFTEFSLEDSGPSSDNSIDSTLQPHTPLLLEANPESSPRSTLDTGPSLERGLSLERIPSLERGPSLESGLRPSPHIQEPLEDSSTHSDLNLALTLIPRAPTLELVTINGESAIAEVKVEEVKLSEDLFKGTCFYIDPEVSPKLLERLQASIAAAGGSLCAQWFIGCKATHVVCEGGTLRKYVGRPANLVTPLWVLRSVERGSLLKSVLFSVDMGRHLASLLGENDDGPGRPAPRRLFQQVSPGLEPASPSASGSRQPGTASSPTAVAVSTSVSAAVNGAAAVSSTEQRRLREQEVQEMKAGVRRRRSKRPNGAPAGPKSVFPLQLLESVCWRITDSPTTARVYCDTDRESSPEAPPDHELQPSIGWPSPEAHSEERGEWHDDMVASSSGGRIGDTKTRRMKQSEHAEVVLRGPFLTLLFPVDRFGELGPRSRGFFSENGFTRQQLLEGIHTFYQEGMLEEEVSLALHTDSKHADRLRALYVAQPTDERLSARPLMQRWELLGSRQNFEGLQRTSRDGSGAVYDVVLSS